MRISRKIEHVRHALALAPSGDNGLADVKLVHANLPDVALDTISLQTTIGELNLGSPIVVNAMTGGAPGTEIINGKLAEAAKERGLAIAVGSQMAALRNPEAAASYRIVRDVNPNGVVIANLGGEATVAQAKAAVEMIGANALQIHLNVMQELIMPEGDRDFRGVLERIAAIADALPVPVIVKEVGFGLTAETAVLLREAGVRIVDVGGSGGTNFAAIENARRSVPLDWLNDWGSRTSVALLETTAYFQGGDVIASGGIDDSLDICKSLALGASAVGIAGAFLRVVQKDGAEGLIREISRIEEGVRIVMAATGADSIARLRTVPVVIGGETKRWCDERGIDTSNFARRRLPPPPRSDEPGHLPPHN